jgi:osmoprotectant transport system substrate-binding protein
MRTFKRLFIPILVLILVAGFGFAAGETEEEQQSGQEQAEQKGPVVVASKVDTEGALLGNMIVQLLEANGFEVTDKTQFGTTDVMRKAITNAEIDIYPEYTGNGAFFFSDTSREVWKDAEQGYQKVKELDKERNDLVWLQPAPANNTWAIAVRRDLAEEHDLDSLEDLGRYVRDGGTFKLAASEEFVTRDDVLPAFEERYNFDLEKSQLLTFSSGNTAQTEQAAAQQTDGVNAAMAYGTDGQLAALGLKVLEDTKNVMPVYEPAPLARAEIIEEYPEIRGILKPVFESLDLETLQRLNAQIAVQGKPADSVAREYLQDQGFLE